MMNVLGYTKDGSIRIEIGGMEMFVPDDPENAERRLIAEWEREGNTIPPYIISESSMWAILRAERDARLARTDWTQVSDAPVDSEVWAVYRQALRDLPQNTTDPNEPQWPEEPV